MSRSDLTLYEKRRPPRPPCMHAYDLEVSVDSQQVRRSGVSGSYVVGRLGQIQRRTQDRADPGAATSGAGRLGIGTRSRFEIVARPKSESGDTEVRSLSSFRPLIDRERDVLLRLLQPATHHSERRRGADCFMLHAPFRSSHLGPDNGDWTWTWACVARMTTVQWPWPPRRERGLTLLDRSDARSATRSLTRSSSSSRT